MLYYIIEHCLILDTRTLSVMMVRSSHLINLGVTRLGCGLGFRVGVAGGWREKCRTHQKQQEGRGRGRVHLCERGRKKNAETLFLDAVLKEKLVN